jgi:serine/threonine protein kinase
MSHTPFQAPHPEHLAELMPQYDIEDFIAQGGMGAVYKGRQRTLDRDVAIKILPKELGDSEFRAAFATEAKAMARLNHPNLIGVFEFGEIDGMPYIVMEYVHGESLYGASHNQAIDPLQAIEIVKGICDGLAHAHENDIVHRDIKPSNILLTLNAKPKIGDFGLAHAADSDQPGLMMGTPGYTAPEVFQNPDLAGQLADIYSVGVILHQLLTGIDPSGNLDPPTELTGNIRLDAIWRKAVSLDPKQRYQSIASMAADMEKWAASKTNSPLISGNVPFTPSTHSAPVINSSPRGGAGILKWAMVAILVGGAFFTYQHLQKNKKDDDKIAVVTDGAKSDVSTLPSSQPATPVHPETPPTTLTPPLPETPSLPETPPVVIHKPETHEISNNEIDEPPFKDNVPVTPEKPVTPTIANQEPKTGSTENLTPGDPELFKRAIGLVEDARKKRDKKLADNASSLISKLSSLIRENKKGEGPTIDDFKKNIVDNRIPEVEDASDPSDKFSVQFKQALASENTIDKAYNTDLTKIRDAYVSRLTTAAKDASDADLKQRLASQAAFAKDLDPWINQLSPEPQWTRLKMKGIVSSKSFVGKWNEHSGGGQGKWIAHPDGRLEIVGRDWIADWKVMENDTLVVQFKGKEPYEYTRDGSGWIGSSHNRKGAFITPGDW